MKPAVKSLHLIPPSHNLPAVLAGEILSAGADRPFDLSATVIVTPTAESGRKLRYALTELCATRNSGLLSPKICTAMQLLEVRDFPLAAKSETLAAWMQAIKQADREILEAVFGAVTDLGNSQIRLGLGKMLLQLGSTLAEAGLALDSPVLAEVCSMDAERWTALASLHEAYRQILDDHGLVDPDLAKIIRAKEGKPPPGVSRVIVACIPDLPLLISDYLGALDAKGVRIELYVPNPRGADETAFDSWGRPVPAVWLKHEIGLTNEQIVVAGNPVAEAGRVFRDYLPEAGSSWGLCVASPETLPVWQAEIEGRGWAAYSPEGKSLARIGAGRFAAAWLDFLSAGSLEAFAPLLEFPAFLSFLSATTGLRAAEVLTGFSELRFEKLFTDCDAAEAYYAEAKPPEMERLRVRFETSKKLAETLAPVARSAADPAGLRRLLEQLPLAEDAEPIEAEAASALGEILRRIEENPVTSAREFWIPLLRLEILESSLYPSHESDAIPLSGWLEAIWVTAETLVVSGFIEGVLPDGIDGDPFLPDSVRGKLGLKSNDDRYAREIFLCCCLLESRGTKGRLIASLARTNPAGEPTRPSRLLFRCGDEALAERAELIFAEDGTPSHQPAYELAWKLNPAKRQQLTRLRVTDFKRYLGSPLEFYYQRVLAMEAVDAAKGELDPMDFGDLVHDVLDGFGKDTEIRDQTDAGRIETYTRSKLEQIFLGKFGRTKSAVLLVQKEMAAIRLADFSLAQAALRREGWRIEDSEFSLPEKGTEFKLGPFDLSARVDRIDIHPDGRRRIIDYKTGRKKPDEVYFVSYKEPFPFPEAQTDVTARGSSRCWADLQLPLYRMLAETKWPDCRMEVGYFLLSEDRALTGFHELALDDTTFASAKLCAETAAQHIARGIFWPPSEKTNPFDAFADLHLGFPPGKVISEEGQLLLQGQ